MVCRARRLSKTHLSLATGQGNVDEAAGVCDALLGTALGGLLLLLGLNLFGSKMIRQ